MLMMMRRRRRKMRRKRRMPMTKMMLQMVMMCYDHRSYSFSLYTLKEPHWADFSKPIFFLFA